MNYIVCNSVSIKKQLVLSEDVDKKRIKIIKNFSSPFQSIENKEMRFTVTKNHINVAYVANFIPYKGHMDLIDICSNLKTKKNGNYFL